jgi:hypothetical protein
MATREAVKVTGKSIAAFYERLQPGVRIECTENTYRPAAAGIGGQVLRSNKSTVTFRRDDNGTEGAIFRPGRVGIVRSITDDSITYDLARHAGHTATWRIVAESHE